MTRRVAAALAAGLVLGACATPAPRGPEGPRAEPPALRHLRILHLNDVADLEAGAGGGGLVHAASTVRAARGTLPRVLVTGGGDLLAPSPASLVLDAAPAAAAWRAIGLGAATPGDRDLALGPGLLARRARESGARWTTANLRAGDRPCCGAEARLLLDVGGVRVGVAGVTGEGAARAARADVDVADPVAAAREAVAALRAGGAEVVLLLAHGEAPLLEVLARVARPDVVLGGHEGTPLATPVGPTAVVRAARGGRDVVQVDVWLEPDGALAGRDVRFLPVLGAPPDPALLDVADRAARSLAAAPPVGTTEVPLDARPDAFAAGESPLGNLLADLARRATGADVALVDAGSVAPRLVEPGPVPAAWPIDLLPDLGPLVVLEVPGADLEAVLEHALARLPAAASRFLQVSGLTVRHDPDARPGERLVSATIGDQSVDPARRYRVAGTARIAAGGDGYGWLRGARRLATEDVTPRLAALLVARLRMGAPLAPEVEGRQSPRLERRSEERLVERQHDEPGRKLGGEVGRLLRHRLARLGHRDHLGRPGPVEQERMGRLARADHPHGRLGILHVDEVRLPGDRLGREAEDPGEHLALEERHVEALPRRTRGERRRIAPLEAQVCEAIAASRRRQDGRHAPAGVGQTGEQEVERALDRRGAEAGAKARGQRVEPDRRDIAEHPVGRQHGDAGVLEGGERHRHEAGGRQVRVRRAVGERGLVAVVAVGDVEPPVLEGGGHRGGDGRVVVGPYPVQDPVGIDSGLVGRPGVGRRERGGHPAVRVAVEGEDGGERGAGRLHEGETIGPGARERPLVRQDHAGLERREPDRGQETAAGPTEADLGLGQVERRPRVAPERPTGPPGAVGLGRPEILRAGRLPLARGGKVDVDHVVGAPREEAAVPLRRDDVVGRGETGVERAGDGRVEAEAAEWTDRGHAGPFQPRGFLAREPPFEARGAAPPGGGVSERPAAARAARPLRPMSRR